MRWPKGPPHLALNPPNLFIFCFFGFVFVPFLSLLCNTKNLVFPLEKGIFVYFLSFSLCSSLAIFGLPLFQCFFLCLSLLLVIVSFLPVFLFCFLLLPCFCLFLSFFSSLLLFHEKNNIRNIDVQSFSSSIFSLFWFPVFLSL